MSSHVCRSYLTSCLKVPIGTCNNCPTPDYNRTKMYLGRLSATPTTSHTEVMLKHCNIAEKETKWSNGGISSLAKLYDSIPDYRDLNHLSGEEFYSTLNTLKSTCHELKLKTNSFSYEDPCSSASSKSQRKESRDIKNKKSKKKKKSTEKSKNESHPIKIAPEKNGNYNKTSEVKAPNILLSKEFMAKDKFTSKQHLSKEVEHFNKSLHEFETEFNQPLSSSNPYESRSCTRTRCSSKESATNVQNDHKNQNENQNVPVRSTFTSKLRARLHKSFSFHDLNSIKAPSEILELRKKNGNLELLSLKEESDALKNRTKLSNYFSENFKAADEGKLINTRDSPNIKESCNRANGLANKTKSTQKRNKSEEYKNSFKMFDVAADKKEKSIKQHLTPSPVHPVARPNLAATLRAESSKKKVEELKNNCTLNDTIPQFDWEVRKTPAWKTLSFNETHQQILRLRLATRKAEQALQQREYELNMELMRQRVKSAPLLLEGPTYCSSHAGKAAHVCQKEKRRICQSNQQRARRKKNLTRNHCCRRKTLFSISSTFEEDNSDSTINTFRVPTESSILKSEKLNTLRKIYGSNGGDTKTQSRNSNHSTNTQQHPQQYSKKNSHNKIGQSSAKEESVMSNIERVDIDSGDDLSSLDRAFL